MAAFVRAALYLVGAIVVTISVHGYLYVRLVRDTRIDGARRRAATIALTVLGSLFPLGMGGLLLMTDLPRPVASPLMWCTFAWVGALLFLLPLLLLGEAPRAWLARRGGGPSDPARRQVIARTLAGVAGTAAVGLSGVSTITAELAPVVRRLRIPVPGLGPTTSGYRIVQISDLHVGATIGGGFVESLVATINQLEPHLVAITGDLVDGSVKELGPLVSPLARLRAEDGVFFVTGNHEYLSGAESWLAFLPTLGVRVLRNEHVSLRGDGGFDLVGIDDTSGGAWVPGHGPDLAAALRGRDEHRPSILLAHRPEQVEGAAKSGVALQLSGHTHGGQIAPIGWALERIHSRYVYGLHKVADTALYVTSGTGYWGPPMRCGTRAEIVVIELTAA